MIGVQIFFEWIASIVEILLYLNVIDTISERRFSKGKHYRFLIFLAGFIALGIVLMNLIDLSISFPTLAYAVIAYSLGAKILFLGRFPEYLFVSIGYVAFLSFIDVMSVAVLNHIGMTMMVQQILSGFCQERIIFIAMIKIIEFIIVILFCILLKKKILYKRNESYIVTVICLVLGGIGSIYYGIRSEILLGFRLSFYQILLSISCALIIGVTYLMLRMREVRQESEYTDRRNQLLEINYLSAKEAYESNARLYHDMRNHFLMIQNYLAGGQVPEAQDYLKRLVGNYEGYGIERWTGIEAIDYLIGQKKGIAEREGIHVHVHSEYPKGCEIDPVDLCTMLTNLLDNAIESCQRYPQNKKREIMLTIRRIHQFIIIRIENTSIIAPVIRNGIPVTSKENKQKHGWGLQNVNSAVEKYRGTIEYTYKAPLFIVSIMLFY